MDADAYLKRLGWRGTGHSLDHTDRGIKKPLLIAHKQDQLGLGTKKAAHKTDDQWWMRAFDQSLQNIGTGKESTLTQIRKSGINRGGLYGFFVQGEGLSGTLSPSEESSATEASTSSSTVPTKESTPATSASEASDDEMSVDTAKPVQKATAASKPKKRKRDTEDTADIRGREKKPKQDTTPSSLQALNEIEITRAASVLKRIEKQSISQAAKEATNWSGKQAKYDKEKAIRKATMQIKKQMLGDALVSGQLPNPRNLGPDQVDQYLCDMEDIREKAREQKKLDRRARTAAADNAAVDDRERISAHIAALRPKKKVEYEQRAARKGRTLEQYVLHRLQKEEAKQNPAKSQAAPLFFVDASADKTLAAQNPQLAQEKEDHLIEKEARIARRRKDKKERDERIDALAQQILIKERGALEASTAKPHVLKRMRKRARKEIKFIDRFGEAAAGKRGKKAEKKRAHKERRRSGKEGGDA